MANFVVGIGAAQSNYNGENDLTINYTADELAMRANVLTFYDGFCQYYQAGFNNRRDAISEQKGNWTIELARLINNSSSKFIFVDHAEGGTGVGAGDRWNVATTTWDDSELEMLEAKIQAFEYYFDNHPKLGGAGHTRSYGCFFWNQGENDAGNSTDANAYQTNCQATWDRIKTAVGDTDIPIYDWKLSANIVGSAAFKSIVNDKKVLLEADVANNVKTLYDTDFVTMMDQNPQFVHYDYASGKTIALNLYNDMVADGIITA